jgi:hypothetical protein
MDGESSPVSSVFHSKSTVCLGNLRPLHRKIAESSTNTHISQNKKIILITHKCSNTILQHFLPIFKHKTHWKMQKNKI